MRVTRLRGRENGPLVIDLPAGTVIRLDGQVIALDRDKLALCRCGQSAAKPLCDGRHKTSGFLARPTNIELKTELERDDLR